MISLIRSLMATTNLNTDVGSPVYFFVILPMLNIYNYINGLISAIDNSPNAENLMIDPIEGTPGTGKLTLSVSTSNKNYVFVIGNKFTNSLGEELLATEQISFSPTSSNTSFSINVKTAINTSKTYNIDEIFTSEIYGDFILDCRVSQQITGGTDAETNYWDRVRQKLAQNTCTKQGVINKIKESYPTLIDICFSNGELLIKSPLEKKEVTLTQAGRVYDCIAKIVESTEPITSSTTYNKETIDEYTSFVCQRYPCTISYLSPTLLLPIHNYINISTDIFPIGYKLIVKHAPIVFVEVSINGILNSSLSNFLLSYPIDKIKLCQILANYSTYKFPFTITFNGSEVVDTYTIKSAYYISEG